MTLRALFALPLFLGVHWVFSENLLLGALFGVLFAVWQGVVYRSASIVPEVWAVSYSEWLTGAGMGLLLTV